MAAPDRIVFDDVSKFYGEVLGINRVNLAIPPGITGLVGPNGSGKTTLMNLMTGLIRPSQGTIHLLGIPYDQPEELFRRVGYCTQFDTFPKGITGFAFVANYLRVHGHPAKVAKEMAATAIGRVGLTDDAGRRVAAYSKGMRQRIKLAQAIAHDPDILILDEPLNGLDPMARAEVIDLFQGLSTAGKHVLISSHILHEVDLISDQVVLLNEGYIVAEGDIRGVRSDVKSRPIKVLIRCTKARELASRLFSEGAAVEIGIMDQDGEEGLLVSTRDADPFYLLFNKLVLEMGIRVEEVSPADEDVQSVYQYLIGSAQEAV